MPATSSHTTGFSPVRTLTVSGDGHPGVVAIAQRGLSAPYVWNEASMSGFDCLGLTTTAALRSVSTWRMGRPTSNTPAFRLSWRLAQRAGPCRGHARRCKP